MTFVNRILNSINGYALIISICFLSSTCFTKAQQLHVIRVQKPDSSIYFISLNFSTDTISKQQAFLFNVPETKSKQVVFKIHNGFVYLQKNDTLMLQHRPGIKYEMYAETDLKHSAPVWACRIDGTTAEPVNSIRIQCQYANAIIFEDRYTVWP